jgi:small subunit ribosomal protein S9
MASLRHGSIALRGCCRIAQSLKKSKNMEQLRAPGIAVTFAALAGAKRCNSTFSDAFDEVIGGERIPPVHARVVPVSPSYFSRQPAFTDSYLRLQKLMNSYKNLPLAPEGTVERVAWKTLSDYRVSVGEDSIKATDYGECMLLVKRLHQIHPKLKPREVSEAVEYFKRDIQPFGNVAKPIPIDRFGRALGVGRRKTSTARAWVVEGTGEVLVNGKSLVDAFGRVHDRESAVWALRATERTDKYNVWALVEGGGTTGQAEALTLAISKALIAHEPGLKPALRRG